MIDLDLVWMVDSAVDEPGLTVPHPGVSRRNFVLYPLADIAPNISIPGHGVVLDLKEAVGGDGISLWTQEFLRWHWQQRIDLLSWKAPSASARPVWRAA